MSRGLERREIFLDQHDRRDLLQRLERLIPEWGGDCFAWSLMPNHVHLGLRTGSTPLAKLMHRLNTGFAVSFNRKHERAGYLFQNRFKSVPVEDDAELMNVVRYVHLNPLRSGHVADLAGLARHPWSGHAALIGARAPYAFESVDRTLALFDPDVERARRILLEWMAAAPDVAEGSSSADGDAFDAPIVLDPPSANCINHYDPVLDTLVDEISRFFGASPSALRAGARHLRESDARAVVAYIAFTRLRCPMAMIARHLGVSRQAVPGAIERGSRIDAAIGPFRPREET
jgi:REP element-mobilizing transposase RayT